MEDLKGKTFEDLKGKTLEDLKGKTFEDLKGKTLDELEDLFMSFGKERFRAKQVFRWMYRRLETDFANMTDLARPFREELEKHYYISRITPDITRKSKDGTVKFLFPLEDGDGVETVFIPDGKRNTICISTQVGCSMGCVFCATRVGGFSRNLTSSEIINQICYGEEFLRMRGGSITNAVFMGMGEPLANIDELIKTIKILNSELSFGISGKRITVSTCGLIPELKRLVSECTVSLAVSLNGTTDAMRSNLMPVNRIYPLEDLLDFMRKLKPKRNRKITVEYLLIKGINDSPEDALRLVQLLKTSNIKVNLIPYNISSGIMFERPDRETIEGFRDTLLKGGVQTIIREERGTDIEAGCGQLRGKMIEKQRKPLYNR